MDFFANLADRINRDPLEQRKLIRARESEVLKERYLKTSMHEWFLKLARALVVRVFDFVFTEVDNSALTATYDFYLEKGVWFQICLTWEENGSVSMIVYDRDGRYYWEPDDLEDLLEHVLKAYENPKTIESVCA